MRKLLTRLGLIYKDTDGVTRSVITHNEKGAINIGGILLLAIGMVFLAVGFIFLPVATDATTDLLNWSYNGTTVNLTDASFTGYTNVVEITPLLILVGFLTAAVVTGMLGVKVMKGGASTRMDPGSLMLLGLTIIFVGIGLIIEPVALDGIAEVLDDANISSYTGYQSILEVSPMLVHIGYLAAAVLSGFFGIKRIGSAGN